MKRTDAKQARNQTECLAFTCSRRNTHLDINLIQYSKKIQHYKFVKGRKMQTRTKRISAQNEKEEEDFQKGEVSSSGYDT